MGSKRSSRVSMCVFYPDLLFHCWERRCLPSPSAQQCCARRARCVGARLRQPGRLHTMAPHSGRHRLCVLTHTVSCSPQRCPDISFIPVRVRLHLSSRSKAFISANGHRRCINPGLCITDVRLLFKCKTSYIHLLTLFRNHFH